MNTEATLYSFVIFHWYLSTKDVKNLIIYWQKYVSVILQIFMHVLTQVNETTYESQPIGFLGFFFLSALTAWHQACYAEGNGLFMATST